MAGRPSDYNDDTAEVIFDGIMSGKSLTEICEPTGMPSERTVYRWLRANEAFRQEYARVREDQGHQQADKVVYLGQKVERGELDPAAGRVAIDAVKWSAGKRNGKYADRQVLAGDPDAPLTGVSDDQLDARLNALLAKQGKLDADSAG